MFVLVFFLRVGVSLCGVGLVLVTSPPEAKHLPCQMTEEDSYICGREPVGGTALSGRLFGYLCRLF